MSLTPSIDQVAPSVRFPFIYSVKYFKKRRKRIEDRNGVVPEAMLKIDHLSSLSKLLILTFRLLFLKPPSLEDQ